MEYVVAEKKGHHGLLVIVTDKDIMDTKFEDARFQLDLTSAFYKGEDNSDEEKIKQRMLQARYIHLTGKHAVQLGRDLGLVDQERILVVENVPHAEVLVEQE